MKVSGIVLLTYCGPALGSLFFLESRGDKMKANLESIGYEVADTAGLVKDSVIESFDRESIEEWLKAHGVHDAGNNALEIAKKHKDWLLEDIKDYRDSTQEKASYVLEKGKEFYDSASESISNTVWGVWSDSAIKEFLDARGIAVPQSSTGDSLRAYFAKLKHNSPINFNGPVGKYWFDGLSRDELAKKLKELGESTEGTRKELSDRLYTSYTKSYEKGKSQGDKAAQSVVDSVNGWAKSTKESFNSWSVDDLKSYLSGFGAEVSGNKDTLVEKAKDNYYYFVHGRNRPKSVLDHVHEHLHGVASRARDYFANILGLHAFVHNDL